METNHVYLSREVDHEDNIYDKISIYLKIPIYVSVNISTSNILNTIKYTINSKLLLLE